jgi:hypothetical protein
MPCTVDVVEELPRFAVKEAINIKSYKGCSVTPCTLICKQCFGRRNVIDNITDLGHAISCNLMCRKLRFGESYEFFIFLW